MTCGAAQSSPDSSLSAILELSLWWEVGGFTLVYREVFWCVIAGVLW